jgi:hypothetical protein
VTRSLRVQGTTNVVMDRLKAEAAKLGANGILLEGVGDQAGGSVGTGYATASGHSALNCSSKGASMRVRYFLRRHLRTSGCILRHFGEYFPLRKNWSVAATTRRLPYTPNSYQPLKAFETFQSCTQFWIATFVGEDCL